MASYRYVSCPISTSNFTLKNRNGSTVLWKAQPHLQWPCQSCGKNKVSFKTFCQVPQKKSKNPSLYILYNFSIQTMHRKKTVSKTYWNSGKMHCYHLVTTKTNHEHKPPQYYFAYSVVMRGCSIIFPRILDWQQLLQHSCRWDSHPAKDKEKESEKKNNHGYIVFVPNGSLVPIFYFNLLFN